MTSSPAGCARVAYVMASVAVVTVRLVDPILVLRWMVLLPRLSVWSTMLWKGMPDMSTGVSHVT